MPDMTSKKKAAIMTWFTYDNYGSVFQAYALKSVVSRYCLCADFINYVPGGKACVPDRSEAGDAMALVRAKLGRDAPPVGRKNIAQTSGRSAAFDRFRENHLTVTQPAQSLPELRALEKRYDCVLCGSDQIWSPVIFNPKYFLDFVDDENKMIAYAPSLGADRIGNRDVLRKMAPLVKRFKRLSVREEQGRKLLRRHFGVDAQVVLDPTLLLEKSDWLKLADGQKNASDFAFAYFLGVDPTHNRHAAALAEKMGLKLRVISPVPDDDAWRNGSTLCNDTSPEAFISSVRDCRCVITDSFHGMVFSILFGKPFVAMLRFDDKHYNSQNSRVYHLLSLLGLKSRLSSFKIADDLALLESFDCAPVHKRLETLRGRSLEYLSSELERASPSVKPETRLTRVTDLCSGCGACAAVCQTGAVTVGFDGAAGLYASRIDPSRCVGCGMCVRVCPMNARKGLEINDESCRLYAGFSTDPAVLSASASGGLAYELSRLFTQAGKPVVGCAYEKERRRAVHQTAFSTPELAAFRRSKYLQSTLDGIDFDRADGGLIVGTPCQIAGIREVMRHQGRENHFLYVDLICHGVPTYLLLDKYLDDMDRRYGCGQAPDLNFRYKGFGWRNSTKAVTVNGQYHADDGRNDAFFTFFNKGLCFAPSCYDCPYRTFTCADIRLGDFWGPRFVDNTTGVSMIVTATTRGEASIEKLRLDGRVTLEDGEVSEYRSVQYPVNPPKPVFYDRLIKALAGSAAIERISDEFVRGRTTRVMRFYYKHFGR